MLKKLLTILTSLLGLLIMTAVAGLMWASHYVDSPQFRKDLQQSLTQITGREVTLHGDLDVTIYPWFGLRAYDITVVNEPGFGDKPYISCREVSLGVRVLPLFFRELVVSEILIDGMNVRLIRNADATVNWNYYRGGGSASEIPIFSYFKKIFIEGVSVKDAVLTFDDGKLDENIRLHGLSASIGAFIPGEAAGFSVSGVFERVRGNLKMEMFVSGILNTNIFSRSSMFEQTSVEVLIQGDGLPEGEKLRLVSDLEYDAADDALLLDNMHFRFFNVDVSGHIELDDILSRWTVSGRVETEMFSPMAILKKLAVKRPLDKVKGLTKAKAAFSFNATSDALELDDIDMRLDETRLTGSARLVDYASPTVSFTFAASRFDLDRYLPLFETGTPFIWDDFSLPFWGRLQASGSLGVQEFKAMDMTYANVKALLSAERGKITASAKGGVYEGLVDANLSLNIDRRLDAPRLWASLKAKLRSCKLGSISFAKGEWGNLAGPADLDVSLLLNQISCPATMRSITALRNMALEVRLSSPSTTARLQKWNKRIELDKLQFTLHAKPETRVKKGYAFMVDSAAAVNQKESAYGASVSWRGPLLIDETLDTVASSGGDWTYESLGWLFPGQDEKVMAKGRASFTPNMKHLAMKGVEVKALNSTLKFSLSADNPLEKQRVAGGHFSLYGFNPEAVIRKFGVDVHEMEDETVFDFLTAHADFKYADSRLSLSDLQAQMDDTTITGKIGAGIQNPPDFTVALKFGRVDLDRYLTPDREVDLKKLRAGVDEKTSPVEMPVEFLKWLTVSGSVWIEEFILQDLKVQDLSGVVEARDGKMHVSDLDGWFYGGTLKGALNGMVHEKTLETSLNLSLHGFEAGPMLEDLAGREYVRGTTDMEISLASQGRTDADILANLNGGIDVSIGSGSYKFMNWDTKLTPRQIERGVTDPSRQRTSFSKVDSKWVVTKGYFEMKEFKLSSPLMTGSGSGGFNPSERSIDLSFKADFAAVPSVTVRIFGNLLDPEVHVPKGKIVTDTLRNIINIPEKSLRFLRDLFF